MRPLIKRSIVILVVALVCGGGFWYYYVNSEPSRYNQELLEKIDLPKGLSSKGNLYCEESRIAWHELFMFLYEHPEYRNLNLEKFNGVYNAEHDYMLMESKDELYERFKIYDSGEQKKVTDFSLKCFKANVVCYDKYFGTKGHPDTP